MKKIISILFVICMLSSIASFAFADLQTDILITAPAESFNVTVPTQLPVYINADGSAQTADGYIDNSSSSTVLVTNVALKDNYGWEYTTGEFVNQRQYKMTINNFEPSNAANAIGSIVAGERKTLNYSIAIPNQHTALTNTKITTVVFTVGWADTISNVPYRIAPKTYNDGTSNWISIASCGDYTLLIKSDTSKTLDVPSFSSVAPNTDRSISIPELVTSGNDSFSLSVEEFNSYCVGSLHTSYDYMLRDGDNSVTPNGEPSITTSSNYRPAVWVKTSSLPSPVA